MRDAENEVRRWRDFMRRTSSLSRLELDELEDHLRTHASSTAADAAAAGTARVFAMARDDLGKPAELSREFAKVGAARTRQLLLAAWILFAVSFLLPVWEGDPGWRAFEGALRYGGILGRISALTNALMLLSVAGHFGRRFRWLPRALAVAAVLNLGFWPIMVLVEGDSPTMLQVGYWAWAISFPCAAAALWRRTKLHGVSDERPAEDTMLEA